MVLTKEQNERLAGQLVGTNGDVYQLAESLFGIEFTEEDWDRLSSDAGIFKCELCGEWLCDSMKSPGTDGVCEECLSSGDEDEDD